MKVVIINPPVLGEEKYIREGRCEQRASSFQYLMVPISLPSIAALLGSKGFKVLLLDCMAEELSSEAAIRRIVYFKPKMVILNFSTATFSSDTKFVLALKKILPHAHLTAIGVHVSALPEQSLIETALDSIIRGEQESTALDLANHLKNKNLLKTVQGISYRGNPSFVNNIARPFISDLDTLPFPARDLLKNEAYKMPVYNRPYTLIIAARGCPNNCSFCTANIYYGTKIRMRSVKNILDEVEEIIQVHKIKDITFWADTFTFDRKYVLDICKGIEERKLKFRWMCNARVDRVDLELLKIMRKAGCQIISYGVESGDQKILNRIGKNITLYKVKKAFKWTREAKIESAAHIIFGLPGETEDTIKKSIKFTKEINPDYVQFYSAIPFPGTRFYDEASKKGWITSKNWNDYELGKNIISTPQLSKEKLAQWRRRAYFEFYLRPGFILRKLKTFIKKPKDLFYFSREAISFMKDWVQKS